MAIITGEQSPSYIKTHIKELEDETCKILSKRNASTVTISKLDNEVGCFIPITIIDIGKEDSHVFMFEVD